MTARRPAVSPAPAADRLLASEGAISQLARPVRRLPPSTTLAAVDEMFRRDDQLNSMAVDFADGPALLTRTTFQRLLIGPLGYGRAVHRRRPLTALVEGGLRMAGDTDLGSAAQQLLDRPADRRYDDALVVGADGSVGLVTMSSVFEQLARQFAHQSMHDPLTGLPNRLLLADAVRRLPAPGLGGASSPALLYVDLDGFKAVNDDFGHDVGDGVLLQYAHRLRDAVRPGDLAARLGGDEFAVLLIDPVTDMQAEAVADRLVLLSAAPFLVGAHVVHLGASVGVARADEVEQQVDVVDALLRLADSAMYRAKVSGRRGTRRPGLDRRRDERDEDRRLLAGLERGELVLAYQPKYELRTGRLLELEALARWDSPSGPVSPAVFIPAAEGSGAIHELGAWALRTACAEAATWPGEGGRCGPVVAVNVSPHQLADPGLVGVVAQALQVTGLPASQLCLEITETAAIDDLPATRERLGLLRALGVQIALDDFGTGYSSLTLLRSLPLDWVKIDRSFVEDVATDPAGAALVRLVIEAAHSLGVLVCAEGVEREDQLPQLAAMGCDAVQGFLLGLPGRIPELSPVSDLGRRTGGHRATQPTLLGGSGAVRLLCDADGRVTYVSADVVALLGHAPSELVGRSLQALLAPAPDRVTIDPLALADHTGAPVLCQALHLDGSLVWVEATVQPVAGRNGAAASWLVTGTDASARVAAEQALADREDRLGAAFDESPVGMALSSVAGRHLKVNAALCRLLGRTEVELLAVSWQDVTHPDDTAADAAQLEATLSGEQDGYRLDKRFLLPDGRAVPCTLHVRVVRGDDGEPRYAVVHVQARPDQG